ncbi:hypothetical protein [Methanococcus maripaludis]|uniref:Uncharacterized protein n=1 Tax=Methanococcus maripaludis TaxID=39152 RepID=A0A8T3VZJ3_METMI|nr:hypothetical protein [Methanococcus maripaludis]MBG0769687.1 hypothetical protein [Methanococcus maripaludis]
MARAKKKTTKKKPTKKADKPKEVDEVSKTLKTPNDSENTEEKKGPDDDTPDDLEDKPENNEFSNLEEIGIFEDRHELVPEEISESPEDPEYTDDPEDFDDDEENEETELKPVNLELDGIMVLVMYLLTTYVFYRLKNLEKATVLTEEIEKEHERVLKGIGTRLKRLLEKYSQRSKIINGIASNLEEIIFIMDLVTLANSIEVKIQSELKKPVVEISESIESVEIIESDKKSPKDVNEALKQMVSKTKVTA